MFPDEDGDAMLYLVYHPFNVKGKNTLIPP